MPSVKLSQSDYEIILTWLEFPGNKDRLFGGGKTKVGEQNATKKKAFDELAEVVNKSQKRDSTLTLDGTIMKVTNCLIRSITGSNYLSWALDASIYLESQGIARPTQARVPNGTQPGRFMGRPKGSLRTPKGYHPPRSHG